MYGSNGMSLFFGPFGPFGPFDLPICIVQCNNASYVSFRLNPLLFSLHHLQSASLRATTKRCSIYFTRFFQHSSYA